MLILTNGLTETADEGFLKTAGNFAGSLKNIRQDVEIVSYERYSELTDTFIKANRFMTNKSVRNTCKKHREVLYMPFPTKKWVMGLRVFLLSRFCEKLSVVLVLKTPIGKLGKAMLKLSKARIIVLSADAAEFYAGIVGKQRVTYLPVGVDTGEFTPVSDEKKRQLREKYGLNADKKIILHVGHLNEGRNLSALTGIKDEYLVLLVTSTFTKNEADETLKKQLLSRPNIKIIDEYIPSICEIYQLSDVYFFPVVECGHCIDVPLSCMEAAACGKPVITTAYGEMRNLIGREGFYLLEDLSADAVNSAIEKAVSAGTFSGKAVAGYDWKYGISKLFVKDEKSSD